MPPVPRHEGLETGRNAHQRIVVGLYWAVSTPPAAANARQGKGKVMMALVLMPSALPGEIKRDGAHGRTHLRPEDNPLQEHHERD